MVVGWRRRLPVGLLLLVAVANVAALALHGSRSDIFVWHRYYVPSYAMAALLAGIGCHEVVTRLPRPARWLPLLLPVAMLVGGWARFDRSRYRVAEDFAARVLAAMPPGAHLIASDDNVLFVLMYLANLNVMRGRPLLAMRHQRAALARAPNSPLYRKNMRVLRDAQRARTRAALEQVE